MSANYREQTENYQDNTAICLYSFRRCPYAIRARLALKVSGMRVEIREVKLSDKPQQLIQLSEKATVPVLRLQDGNVIDESLDIMIWALSRSDPMNWIVDYADTDAALSDRLITENDLEFKPLLDQYKYADRYPELSRHEHRSRAEKYIAKLDRQLAQTEFLTGSNMRLADAAIMPFVRQFAGVEPKWFENCEHAHVRVWLDRLLDTDLFHSTMRKYTFWKSGDEAVYF